MGLQLSVLNTSDVPIYKQLYDQIAAQVLRGDLAAGECLPPIRAVASELGISVITIKRAWEDLERDGFIVTMVGRGCFVTRLSKHDLEQKREELAELRFRKDIPIYRQLGLTRAELHEIIDRYYSD